MSKVEWLKQLEEGEAWEIKYREGFARMRCCDCGLVHDLAFDVEEDVLYMYPFRNERSTAQSRRNGWGGLQNGDGSKWRLVRVS